MTLLLLALAPGVVIALYIYMRDKYEREPFKPMAWTFALGGLAAILAGIFEAQFPYQEKNATLLQTALNTTLVVGPAEELAKFLVVLFAVYNSPEFNEPFDGIVYCVMASMGFATLENIMYVMSGGVGVGLERALISVPGHAAYAAIMGYYLGRAKFDRRNAGKLIGKGLLFAALAHGVYDFGLFSHTLTGLACTALAFVVAIACAFRAIRESSKLSGAFWAANRA